jgi:NAD(P)H-flavin reductase
MVYTCGPERMMQKMFLLAEKFDVPFEASLERFHALRYWSLWNVCHR